MAKVKNRNEEDLRGDHVMHIRHNATTTHHWGGRDVNEEYFDSLYRSMAEGRDLRDCFLD